jgi:hypothetical protein
MIVETLKRWRQPGTARAATPGVASVAFLCLCAPLTIGLLASPAVAARESWPFEARWGRFAVYSDVALNDHQNLFRELRQLEKDVTRELSLPSSSVPIHIFLFSNKATYQRYLRQWFPKIPQRRAMFIKKNGPAMVFAVLGDNIAVDLRHETTHALLHTTHPSVPLWLDEGIAEYFETPREKRRTGHPEYLSKTQWASWFRLSSDLPRLESLDDMAEMDRSDYRQAWSWVHFFLHGPNEGKVTLYSYLADLRGGRRPQKMSDRLGDATKQYLQHFRR